MISPSDLTDAPKVVPATAFGRRFRSTTEARWAVLLTELGIPWEYESETYDLGAHGWYLPDFWLVREGWFLEIKPGRPRLLDKDYDKARALYLATGRPVLVASGFGFPPSEAGHETDPGWIYDIFTNQEFHPAASGGSGYRLFAATCGRAVLGLDGHSQGDGYYTYHRPDTDHRSCRLVRWGLAYEAAASYRPDER